MLWTPEILIAAGVAAVAVGALLFLLIRRSPAARREIETPAPAPAARTLREGLTKTRQGLLARLQSVWGAGRETEARLADLEEILLTADVGVKATQQLLSKLRSQARELADAAALRAALREHMVTVLADGATEAPEQRPHVIVVAGVNGVGKTTTIGKLAHRYRRAGKKVLLVAADTFRAAAGEQLEVWAQRVGVHCVRHQAGADPSAVAFDGLKAALARDIDVVIIDTAGRLHVKAHLIDELKKIVRVIGRQVVGAPQETLLVIDATTGQNAINQARVFQEALQVTGVVLTKLDGTAKGGAIFAVRAEVGLPIRYVGLGEGLDDLAPFDAGAFVDALLEPSEP
jgi:fused signal recognition particle receptor